METSLVTNGAMTTNVKIASAPTTAGDSLLLNMGISDCLILSNTSNIVLDTMLRGGGTSF